MRLIFLFLVLVCNSVMAQSTQCNFIQDRDKQANCRATTGGGIAQCGFIKDRDLQAMCRAEAGKDKGQCGFIKDRDKQAQCRANI
jgi:hypothetical protein